MNSLVSKKLQQTLVSDECFDLELYRRFKSVARSKELQDIFSHLVLAEEQHVAIWQKHFPDTHTALSIFARAKLTLLVFVARLTGDVFIRVCVEAIEIHGIRKYLQVAHIVDGSPIASDLAGILRDELEHEESVVVGDVRARVTGDRIRSFLFGFNDGLVEVTGAVVGFSATFSNPSLVVTAGLVIVFAGAFSMGAGAFASTHAEREVGGIDKFKEKFLGGNLHHEEVEEHNASPLVTGLITGIAYIIGGLAPLAPYAFGDLSLALTLASSLAATLFVSWVIAFLSGMQARKRMLMNLMIVSIAVAFSYASGYVIDHFIVQ